MARLSRGLFAGAAALLPAGCAVGDWVGVSVGEHGGCAWQADGRVGCWMDDLANGVLTRGALEPPSGLRVSSLAVGVGGRACAVTEAGPLSCWSGESGTGPECQAPPAWGPLRATN